MELDEYKIALKHRPVEDSPTKDIPELEEYLRLQTHSVMDNIKNNLRLEILFALLFLVFDCYVWIFSNQLYQQLFTVVLFIFCACFVYYLVKLLNYIRGEFKWIIPVRDQLEQYIRIIARFTRLYFQLTMIMIPLVFLLAYISGYLDQSPVPGGDISFNIPRSLIYLGVAILWSCLMYFFTRWYIKKLYGNHLDTLKNHLRELQNEQ